MKTKKILLNALPLLLIGTAMVYAAAPSGGYLPGATNDPACAPGDVDCFVLLPSETPNKFVDGDAATDAVFTGGNVGIGTTAPSEELVVAGDNFVEVSILSQQSANGDNLGGYRFSGLDSVGTQLRYAGINGAINDNLAGASEGTLIFQTVVPGGGLTNRMSIVGGNVGIGTTSPSRKLHVYEAPGSGSAFKMQVEGSSPDGTNLVRIYNNSAAPLLHGLRFEDGNTFGSVGYADIAYATIGGTAGLSLNADGSGASTDTDLFIEDATGNVGIGTTSPSDGTAAGGQALRLDVEGAIGATHYCDQNGENCFAPSNVSRHTSVNLAGKNNYIKSADIVGDTSVTLNSGTLTLHRVGNMVTLGMTALIGDFSFSAPHDDSMIINFDLEEIGLETGMFSNVETRGFSNFALRPSGPGIDYAATATYTTATTHTDANPNALYIASNQLDGTGQTNGGTSTTATNIRYTGNITFEVSD